MGSKDAEFDTDSDSYLGPTFKPTFDHFLKLSILAISSDGHDLGEPEIAPMGPPCMTSDPNAL